MRIVPRSKIRIINEVLPVTGRMPLCDGMSLLRETVEKQAFDLERAFPIAPRQIDITVISKSDFRKRFDIPEDLHSEDVPHECFESGIANIVLDEQYIDPDLIRNNGVFSMLLMVFSHAVDANGIKCGIATYDLDRRPTNGHHFMNLGLVEFLGDHLGYPLEIYASEPLNRIFGLFSRRIGTDIMLRSFFMNDPKLLEDVTGRCFGDGMFNAIAELSNAYFFDGDQRSKELLYRLAGSATPPEDQTACD